MRMRSSIAVIKLAVAAMRAAPIAPTRISTRISIMGGCLKKPWAPSYITSIEGTDCLQISYQDRGLAQYCGVPLDGPHPLQQYQFIDHLRKLRNDTVVELQARKKAERNQIFAEAAAPSADAEGLAAYVLKAQDNPAFVVLDLPAIKYQGEEHDAIQMQVAADVCPTKMVQVVLTEAVLPYIRLAILAGGARTRQSRKRDDRVIVDVPGVRYRYNRQSMQVTAVDHDDRKHKFSKKMSGDTCGDEAAHQFKDQVLSRDEVSSIVE